MLPKGVPTINFGEGGGGNGGEGGSGTIVGNGGSACGTVADSNDVTTAIINPDLMGSGGGSGSGGSGGGAIKLVVGGELIHSTNLPVCRPPPWGGV